MFVDCPVEQDGPAQTESAFCERLWWGWYEYNWTLRSAGVVVKNKSCLRVSTLGWIASLSQSFLAHPLGAIPSCQV